MHFLYAFDIDRVDESELNEILKNKTNFFRSETLVDFKRLLNYAILAVHGIPKKLYEGDVRSKLSIYYGRTTATPENVISRWKNSKVRHSHTNGLILGEVPTENIRNAEENAIRIFQTLQVHGKLCINTLRNISSNSVGQLSTTESSILYLTWGIDEDSREIKRPTQSEIKEIASDAFERVTVDLSKKSLRDIFSLTRRYAETVPVRWHKNHS